MTPDDRAAQEATDHVAQEATDRAAQEATDRAHREALETADNLLERLYRYAVDEDTFILYRRTAWEQFFGPLVPAGQLPEDHPDWDAFDDWFIFDFRLDDGQTPFDRFARLRGHSVENAERPLLARWRDDVFGVFAVDAVESGSGARLRDLADDTIYRVLNVKLSRRGSRWDHLIGRLMPVGDFHGFSSEVRFLTPALLPALPGDFTGAEPPGDRRARSVELWRAARRLAAGSMQVPVTDEGDVVRPSVAAYAIRDYDAVVALLDRLPYLSDAPQHEPGERWYDWMGAPPAGIGDKILLGMVRVLPDSLILECLSPERLARGRVLFEPLVAGLADHQRDTVADPPALAPSAEDSSRMQAAGLALGEVLMSVARNDRLPALARAAAGSEAAALLEHFDTEPIAVLAGLHHPGALAVHRVVLHDDRAAVEFALEQQGEVKAVSSARFLDQGQQWLLEMIRPGWTGTSPSEAASEDSVVSATWLGTWQWAPVGPAGDHPILGIALKRLHLIGRPILEQALAIRLWNDFVARANPSEAGDEDWAIALGEITDWVAGRADRPTDPLPRRILDTLRVDFAEDQRYAIDRPVL